MTRLPVETWQVRPRLDLPLYELNTVCPVTGESSGLEDHHIFRRSFTALGKEQNDALYWVEYIVPNEQGGADTGSDFVVRNRVALSPDAHQRITVNKARLEYRGIDLYYVEGGEEKKLDLNLRLMADGEKVSRRRRKPKASTPEERKARVNYTIRTPKDEENVLPEWEEILRASPIIQAELSQIMDEPEEASSYWVWATTAKVALGL